MDAAMHACNEATASERGEFLGLGVLEEHYLGIWGFNMCLRNCEKMGLGLDAFS